jgi:hypothetical protein
MLCGHESRFEGAQVAHLSRALGADFEMAFNDLAIYLAQLIINITG